MSILIDTNIAVHLRDGEPMVLDRLGQLSRSVSLSAISRAELENGVYRDPVESAARRVRLDFILSRLSVVAFDDAAAGVFSRVVQRVGVSRPRTIDRMIAATAMLHDMTFITMNGRDFRDIPGLKLDAWDSPA